VQPIHNDVEEDISLREKFIKKQKELLELQQKKLELELLQTKNQMEIQKKRSMNKINLSKVNLFYINFKTYHLFKNIYRTFLMQVHHLQR